MMSSETVDPIMVDDGAGGAHGYQRDHRPDQRRCDVSELSARAGSGSRPRGIRGRLLLRGCWRWLRLGRTWAAPYVPASDSQVVAELPAGARHSNAATRDLARSRLDIALPMAQFYLSRARATGDLRFLGYAEAILAPWLERDAGVGAGAGTACHDPAKPARLPAGPCRARSRAGGGSGERAGLADARHGAARARSL